MNATIKVQVTMEISVDVSDRGDIVFVSSPDPKLVRAAIAERLSPADLAKRVAEKTAPRLHEGFVRVVGHGGQFAYRKILGCTKLHVRLGYANKPDVETKWRLSDGYEVGQSNAWTAPKIHSDDLQVLRAEHEKAAKTPKRKR